MDLIDGSVKVVKFLEPVGVKERKNLLILSSGSNASIEMFSTS